MWLVDSSALIDWIRCGQNPVRILRPFVAAGHLVSCGMVRVEVIRGIVKPSVKDEMSGLFDAIPEVPLTPAMWAKVTDLGWTLDRKGIILPASDLVIGACALEAKACVISTDSHFTDIPGLRVRPHLPDIG